MERARNRTYGLLLIGLSLILAFIVLPTTASSQETYTYAQGAPCSDCHGGTNTDSLLSVIGIPATWEPGMQYNITVTVNDLNGAGTGENGFVIQVSDGVLSATDPNVGIDTNTTASAATDYTVNSWTLKWTAPVGASVVSWDSWAVMGDGAGGTDDNFDNDQFSSAPIPEFSELIIPVIGIIGLMLIFRSYHKKH